jgi:predicted RNase H-related nuclease YkuK (DUF458 family)
MLEDTTFNNPSVGTLDGTEMIDELIRYANEAPSEDYQVTIGTDSRGLPNHSSFVSVVAIHRVGHGGRYFWHRFEREAFGDFRKRIYLEATRSVDIARKLTKGFEDQLERVPDEFDFDFEIHVDVGRNGPTSDMIQEIVGMVRGYGYSVRTKPDAYCAAIVADRYA